MSHESSAMQNAACAILVAAMTIGGFSPARRAAAGNAHGLTAGVAVGVVVAGCVALRVVEGR